MKFHGGRKLQRLNSEVHSPVVTRMKMEIGWIDINSCGIRLITLIILRSTTPEVMELLRMMIFLKKNKMEVDLKMYAKILTTSILYPLMGILHAG